jgi:hypothetical protein
MKIQELFKHISSEDAKTLRILANRLLKQGWTKKDVIAYLRCTEEVNPDLPELIALGRMTKLASKYKEMK